MAKRGSFLKGILQYSISTWANFLLGVISVVITTRLLMPDTYGRITMFNTVSSVLLYVLTLGLDGAYIRFYNEPPGNDSKQQTLYKNLIVALLVCTVVGTVTTIFWGEEFTIRIFGIGGKFLAGVLFVNVFCNIILRFLNISFRMSFRVWNYNLQNILINSLSKLLIITAAIFTNEFVYIVTLLVIGMIVLLSVYCFTQRKEYIPITKGGDISLSLSFKGYNDYFKFALFSAPAYIIHYLNNYLNQQVIVSMMSAYALGIFSSTTMFGHVLSAVKGGFSTYWSAYVYQNYGDDHKRIEKMHDYVVVFSIAAVSGLVFFRDFLYLLIGREYHSSKVFFSLLLVMPVFNFITETTDKGIALAKKNHITLISHTIAVVLNLALSLVLIPVIGLIGAACANAFSSIVLFGINTYFGQKFYKTIIDVKKSIFGFGSILAILCIPALISNIFVIVPVIALVDCLALIIYKKEIKVMTDMVKTKVFRKNN